MEPASDTKRSPTPSPEGPDHEGDWFSNDAATFGDRLTWAREAAGLSESDLAKRLGVTLQTLHSWEGDTSEPRANRLQMLAGLLGVSMSWLITGEGEGLDGGTPPDPVAEELGNLVLELGTLRRRMIEDAERMAALERRVRARLETAPHKSHG